MTSAQRSILEILATRPAGEWFSWWDLRAAMFAAGLVRRSGATYRLLHRRGWIRYGDYGHPKMTITTEGRRALERAQLRRAS